MSGRRASYSLWLLLGIAVAACSGSGSPPDPPPSTSSPTDSPTSQPTAIRVLAPVAPTGPTENARVARIIDGDTIEVALDGRTWTVRYVGIDTPETKHGNTNVEWMGPQAAAANKGLVANQTVVLEKDTSETDRYGRLLRYVWLDRGDKGWLLVNLRLVERGFAQVATFPPDVKYADVFVAAERRARDADVGLWGPQPTPTSSATPKPKATPRPTPRPTAEPAGDCDPSYPGVCIPPPPPDLDCGDIVYRRFDVLPPDPHNFDGDGDGIGCES